MALHHFHSSVIINDEQYEHVESRCEISGGKKRGENMSGRIGLSYAENWSCFVWYGGNEIRLMVYASFTF